jgi:hypothetical protein
MEDYTPRRRGYQIGHGRSERMVEVGDQRFEGKLNNTASAIPMRASDFGRVSDHEFGTRESSRCYAGVVVRRRVVSSNIKYTAAPTIQLKTVD